MDTLDSQVDVASHEQSQGITQISSAVTQMEKVTQGNAASAEESAAAAQELNSQAEALRQAVQELQNLMLGRADAQARLRSTSPALESSPARAHKAPPYDREVSRKIAARQPAAVTLEDDGFEVCSISHGFRPRQ